MALDQKFKERLDLLDKSGYLAEFVNMARRMCAPFWWSSRAGGELAEVRANGTMCLVNTGERHLGITCDHVFQGFLDDQAKFPDVQCQFGGNTIRPEDRLIARSPLEQLDLATFDVPVVFVSASLEPHYHHNALRWPPDPLRDTDVVFYGGHPQVLRNPKTLEVEFPFQWFVTRVNSVTAERIVLEPAVSNVYWPGHEGEAINVAFGGMSGGPVYRVVDANSEKGIFADRLELVGFIDRQILGDLILAKPAQFVNADGMLKN